MNDKPTTEPTTEPKTREEFLASLSPDARAEAEQAEESFLLAVKQARRHAADLVWFFDTVDWTDKQIWCALAFLKGTIRYAESLDHSDERKQAFNSAANETIWKLFDHAGFSIMKHQHAAPPASPAAPEAFK